MRVGLYGGSFNPVHHGHLITATRAAELRSLDKVILMPAFISPLRQGANIIAGEHRVAMLELATRGNTLFSVSDYELKKAGVSYTIDTVRHLRETYDELELIIGYDNFAVLDRWREPDELLRLATIVVLQRKLQKEQQWSHHYAGLVHFIETPFVDISSTEIRERVMAGRSIDYLTPPAVVSYVKEHQLYRE
jgi:nicotinate-nucleotide adenylyltransferase